MGMENGPGPHATPLVTQSGVYAIGILGNLVCLDKKTGKLRWSHNLYQEFHGTFFDRGYAPSPVAYRGMVIMKVGGQGHSFLAFDQKTGAVIWTTVQTYDNSPATPLLIKFDGQDQLVAPMSDDIVGIDPGNGQVLWRYPHHTSWGLNISVPVWGEDHLLFFSSAYNGGSAVIRLTRQGSKTVPVEVWSNNRVRVHFSTTVRVGDYVYGSSGDFGPAPLTAVDVKSGKVVWQSYVSESKLRLCRREICCCGRRWQSGAGGFRATRPKSVVSRRPAAKQRVDGAGACRRAALPARSQYIDGTRLALRSEAGDSRRSANPHLFFTPLQKYPAALRVVR
jgi:outer membrane protein assembly factor BamB